MNSFLQKQLIFIIGNHSAEIFYKPRCVINESINESQNEFFINVNHLMALRNSLDLSLDYFRDVTHSVVTLQKLLLLFKSIFSLQAYNCFYQDSFSQRITLFFLILPNLHSYILCPQDQSDENNANVLCLYLKNNI